MALQNDPKIPSATRRKVQKAADQIGYRCEAIFEGMKEPADALAYRLDLVRGAYLTPP